MALKDRKLPVWIGAPLALGTFGLLYWLERRRPLRRRAVDEPKPVRTARNLAVAALGATALQLVERPVVEPLAELVERRGWGLLKALHLPAWIEVPLTVLLLDYTLYLWHILTHRTETMWRFHVVHHADLDMDASTAIRFHFGELTISVAWRAGQVLLIGASPLALSIWQTLVFPSILFHHSNVEIPIELERTLARFLVTPRIHGIHHSIVREETDSNYSSGLSIWDRLHGTLRVDVPQDEITIGVPAFQDPEEVTIGRLLVEPFKGEQRGWQLPDGTVPVRDDPHPDARLLAE